ncbi:MAG: hypothetical protein ACRDDY_13870 [Clostridium sp.]|uniref:hypothetical protein n=1 Tax=Clostridium sp. TaxID=1506 RepID=UPI003EE5561D
MKDLKRFNHDTMIENATIEKVAVVEKELWDGKRKPFPYASDKAYRVYKRFPQLRLEPAEAEAVLKSKVPRMALAGHSALYPEKTCFFIDGRYFTRVDFELWSVVDLRGKLPKDWECEIFNKPQYCGI